MNISEIIKEIDRNNRFLSNIKIVKSFLAELCKNEGNVYCEIASLFINRYVEKITLNEEIKEMNKKVSEIILDLTINKKEKLLYLMCYNYYTFKENINEYTVVIEALVYNCFIPFSVKVNKKVIYSSDDKIPFTKKYKTKIRNSYVEIEYISTLPRLERFIISVKEEKSKICSLNLTDLNESKCLPESLYLLLVREVFKYLIIKYPKYVFELQDKYINKVFIILKEEGIDLLKLLKEKEPKLYIKYLCKR